ncbi:hypothetical protein DVH24_006228 [Malus domestica]|uniref:Uncharacterized protein n=1 Tax=Malus domestica TaxID=3750 RepID=A0A498KC23_MALDO|nr:hypothetical protein DVH24_006228 [Malus domestica]
MENRALTPINQLVPYINAEKSRFEFAEYADQGFPKLLVHIQSCIVYYLPIKNLFGICFSHRGEELTVTLWADVARISADHCGFHKFKGQAVPRLIYLAVFLTCNFSLIFQHTDKIVLNTIGSSLFFIDLDILEVNSYKSVFSKCTEPLKILPPFTKQAREAQILQTAKVTIADTEIFMPKYDVEDEKFFVGNDLLPIVKELPWDMLYALASQLPLLGGVVQVRLERLEVRNAIGNDTLKVRILLLTNVLLINSKAPKMFCAGADLKVRLERLEVRNAIGKDVAP